MSTVVVTGASGSLGRRVVTRLAGDATVTRLVAIDMVAGPPGDGRVEHHLLDLAAVDGDAGPALDDVMRGADAVIHLAWSHQVPSSGRSARPAPSANLTASRQVLAAAGRAGVGRLVLLSSGTVYGAWPDNPVPLAEDAAIRPNPGFAFAAEKAEAERMVAEWSERRPGAVVTILRPAVTVGARGPALYRALARSAAPRSDDAGRPMQFLHVDDLASAVVVAWRQALAGVCNVAPDGWIGDDTARTLSGGGPRLALPARLAGTVSAWSWDLLGHGTPRQALPYVVHPWVLANDRLASAGWRPTHTNEEALVSADDRPRWLDLPLNRRQGLVLAGAVTGLVAAGGATAAVVSVLIRRRRRARTARS